MVVLERKIKRNLGPDEDTEVVDYWVGEASRTAADMVALGLVDDRGFATARARSLHRKGKSRRVIIRTLVSKGVNQDHIDWALAALGDDLGGGKGALEFEAAINLARRRKLGPFRRADRDSSEQSRRRAQGVLARAGFSYAVASQILGATGEAELLDHLEDLRADEAGHED